jgi:hypothetical protein
MDDRGGQPQDALLDAIEDLEVDLWLGGRDGDARMLGARIGSRR